MHSPYTIGITNFHPSCQVFCWYSYWSPLRMVKRLREGLCVLLKLSPNLSEWDESSAGLTTLSHKAGSSEISASPFQGGHGAWKPEKDAKRVMLLACDPCWSLPQGIIPARQRRLAAHSIPRALCSRANSMKWSRGTENSMLSISKARHICLALHSGTGSPTGSEQAWPGGSTTVPQHCRLLAPTADLRPLLQPFLCPYPFLAAPTPHTDPYPAARARPTAPCWPCWMVAAKPLGLGFGTATST